MRITQNYQNSNDHVPENNGALERSHRILAEYLRHYINEEIKPTRMSGSHTRYSHIILHYIWHQTILRSNCYTGIKLHCLQPCHYLQNQHTPGNYAEELKQRLRATQQIAKLHINEAKIKAKIYADKNLQDRR